MHIHWRTAYPFATKRRTHRARVLCKPKRLLQCCVPWAHPLHAGMQVRRNLSEVVEAATKTPDQARDSRPAIGQEVRRAADMRVSAACRRACSARGGPVPQSAV